MPAIDTDRKAAIQFELRRRGITQKQIAAATAVTEGTVSKVLAGVFRNPRVEAEIEQRTGLKLFPDPAAA